MRFPVLATAAAVLLGTAAAPLSDAAAQGDPRAGRRLAGGQCAACHGNDGIAVAPGAPNLAGQVADYVAAQLRAYRSGERRNEVMSVAAQGLTDAQIADLAAWYASIEVEARVPGR